MKNLLVYPALFDLSLVLFHLGFWKLFHWSKQLALLHPTNKGAMQAMNIALICTFSLFGYLLLAFPSEVITTPLGRTLLAGVATMWGVRSLVQVVFFPRNHRLSWGFFLFFCLGTALHLAPLMGE